MIKFLCHSPLSIAVQAGRTCWNSHDKGGCYTSNTNEIIETDKEFLHRILCKHKHLSVSEHIRIVFKTYDNKLLEFFKYNPFSVVTDDLVSTNLRVLLEHKETLKVLIENLPKELNFLFEDNGE